MIESMEMEEKIQQFEEDTDKIIELLDNRSYFKAKEEILKYNEVDIGEILEEVLERLGIEKTIIIFRMLPKDISVEVFSYLPSDDQLAIIDGITDRETSYLINELDFDDMIDVLEELPANIVDKILEKTPKEERKLINTFLNYPEGSAGSLMTPDYIGLKIGMTCGEAIAFIKKVGMDTETIYTCYVKGLTRDLEGIVSLRSIITSDEDTPIADIMNDDYVYVSVHDDQEEVAETFKKYGFLAIPVVDNEHKLVGIITVDDIMDVIEEEATEDIERMAGVMDDSDTEYLDMGVFRHARNRLPWLLFMTVTLMITGFILTKFELVLSQVIVLVSYLPLLMGTGGNVGTQAASLIIRGMSVGDVDTRDALRVLWKEFRISLVIGLVLSAFNFFKILLLDGESVLIAATVAISMITIVTFGKLLGSMLPIGAKKIGIDPALMATPMIQSISDMVSSTVYMLIAAVVLGITL